MSRPARPPIRFVLAGLVLLTSPLAAAEPVSRLEIVDRAIEHHGGDLYETTRTRLDVCSLSGCFDVEAQTDGEAFALEVGGGSRDGVVTVRITNDEVRHWLDGEAIEVPQERQQALRDFVMERVYFTFLPYRLNDPSALKTDLGLETWGQEELHKVKVTFEAGSSTDADDEFLYWFEPDTGRLRQFAYSYTGRPGGLRFRRLFNYRRIGGILFFDQENYGLEGDDLEVEQVTPERAAQMRRISTVQLREFEVVPLS